jgi:hypothetical protein
MAAALGYCVVVEKGLSGWVSIEPFGSFDCADHDKAVICFAQDDADLGGLKEDKGNWLGDGLLGVLFFVGGNELPAPGFGQVFEVRVLCAD